MTLSTVRPGDILDTPAPQGSAYYGFLPVGTKDRLALMVDLVWPAPGRVQGVAYIATRGDGSLRDAARLSFENSTTYARTGASATFPVTISYDDESTVATLRVEVRVSPAPQPSVLPGTPTPTPATGGQPATVTAVASTRTLRVLNLPDSAQMVYIADQSGRGTFDSAQAQVLQDVDGNGVASPKTSAEVQSARNAIVAAGTREAWRVASISPSGRTVWLAPLAKATLSGRVQTTTGARSIADATVQVWPGPFETSTRSDGSYSLKVYATQPWKMLVKREGYVPYSLYLSNKSTAAVRLQDNAETAFNVAMTPVRSPPSGTIGLSQLGSFIGAAGIGVADEAAGDFALRLGQRTEVEGFRVTWAQVCACYEGQGGVVEIGSSGAPLDDVPIPAQGYVTGRFLDLRRDYVYVARAREGQEGKYVVLRVDSMAQGAITVSYLFR